MKKHTLLIYIALFCSITALAQDFTDACTSIMVGRLASTDGSVMTSHTCDGSYRTWMSIEPAQTFSKDTTVNIYDNLMHTEHSKDMSGTTVLGTIPQVKHTYRFLNAAYPCLNEKQLGIGETTITGRKELRNKQGMFRIEELERIALQRCSTARDAIRLMGELIKTYGYGDSGECLTVADKQEVWIFEVFGEGAGKIGGVWAAQRIPDDCIAVSANICRIGKIDTKDKDNFMYSDNVFDVAESMKLWDGKGEFSFWKAYSGGNYNNEPKNYSVRELFIMQQLAPSAGFTDAISELPVAVKPDKKVSAEDVMHLLASYYEGTDKSLSNRIDSIAVTNPTAMVSNPWMRPDEIARHSAEINDPKFKNIRTVSVSWCSYSTVIQLRSWLPDEVGGVAWISLDNPGQSPRFPIFSGNTALPALLSVCGQHRDRDDAALTHYRHANRLATVRWGKARKTMIPAQQYFIDKGFRELPFVENTWKTMNGENPKGATAFLNGYTADFFHATIGKWDELEHSYWFSNKSGF